MATLYGVARRQREIDILSADVEYWKIETSSARRDYMAVLEGLRGATEKLSNALQQQENTDQKDTV